MNKYLQDFASVESKQALTFEDGMEFGRDTLSMESDIRDCLTYVSALEVLAETKDTATVEALSIALGAPISVVEDFVSTEGMKDMARKSWDAIKKVIKTILAWFKKHWNKMFGKKAEQDLQAKENEIKLLPAPVLAMGVKSNEAIVDASPADKKERNKETLRRGLIAFASLDTIIGLFKEALRSDKVISVETEITGDTLIIRSKEIDVKATFDVPLVSVSEIDLNNFKEDAGRVNTMLNELPDMRKGLIEFIESMKKEIESIQESPDKSDSSYSEIKALKISIKTLKDTVKYSKQVTAATMLRKEFEELLTK